MFLPPGDAVFHLLRRHYITHFLALLLDNDTKKKMEKRKLQKYIQCLRMYGLIEKTLFFLKHDNLSV